MSRLHIFVAYLLQAVPHSIGAYLYHIWHICSVFLHCISALRFCIAHIHMHLYRMYLFYVFTAYLQCVSVLRVWGPCVVNKQNIKIEKGIALFTKVNGKVMFVNEHPEAKMQKAQESEKVNVLLCSRRHTCLNWVFQELFAQNTSQIVIECCFLQTSCILIQNPCAKCKKHVFSI